MNTEEYEKMYSLEDTYWWFQGRMHIIRGIIDTHVKEELRTGRVLDLGCGTGLMLERLQHLDPVGLDFSPLSLQYCRRRGARHLVRADVVKLPFASNSMDLVLALDLIEHVKDDAALAAEVHRILRPGGWFMATVPAHQWLWSDHDVSLHHQRRYSHPGFRRLLTDAGLTPVKYSYAITYTYLPIVVFRALQRLIHRFRGPEKTRPKTHLIPLPPLINRWLIALLKVEARILKRANLPFGISLMALCRKDPG
jgi:SAM-dependent methyltransferase